MTVGNVLDFLNSIAPPSLAESYDNVGLLIGNRNAEVTGILVSLDCFSEVIDRAEDVGANLIVTHHPIIFDPLRSVTEESLQYKLIRKGISVISAHTNLDQADGGVNDALCAALGLYDVQKVSGEDGFFFRIGELDGPEDPYTFARNIKEALGGGVKFVAGKGDVSTVAVCSGSGGSMLYDALRLGADALVTGDVKHNVFIDAGETGISLYDAGHFNTEDTVIEPLCRKISEAFPDTAVFSCHFSKIENI